MAGMGPAPKPASTRARRNRTSTAAVIKADPKLEAPELPAHPDGREWHPSVLAWWSDTWKSPMAPEYDPSDRHGLFVGAMLRDEFWRPGTSTARRTELAAEIRLQDQRFGQSPIDRRRLQWEIERTEEAQDRGEKRRAARKPAPAPTPAAGDDARAVLRAVK